MLGGEEAELPPITKLMNTLLHTSMQCYTPQWIYLGYLSFAAVVELLLW